MPPRSKPTARQVRLGAELRKMRDHAGMTGREAAARLGVSPMQMSHMEVGRIGVSEERLRRLASQYGCEDQALVNALAAMTRRRERGWWEAYRGIVVPVLLDLAELEHHAHGLRTFQVVHIPGLLQTEAHIRALYGHTMPDLPSSALDAIVEFRVKRRGVLDREEPAGLDVIVHEAALRIRPGDRKVARDQLEFLLQSADRPLVTLRVLPFDGGGFTEASFPVLYMKGPVPPLDTAQFDAVHGSVFVDDEEQLAGYRGVLDAAEAAALSPAASLDLIRRIAREL